MPESDSLRRAKAEAVAQQVSFDHKGQRIGLPKQPQIIKRCLKSQKAPNPQPRSFMKMIHESTWVTWIYANAVSIPIRVLLFLALNAIGWLAIPNAQGQLGSLLPLPLHGNARTDLGSDYNPQLSTDGQGNWIAVWSSTENLNGTAGTDADILVSRSTDNGSSWSPPALLNLNGTADTGQDQLPRIANDRQGNWLVVWQSSSTLGGTAANDFDIFFSVSSNAGVSWSPPAALNSNANSDAHDDRNPALATDGKGVWVATWDAANDGLSGGDTEIFFARSVDNGRTWSGRAVLNRNSDTDAGSDFHASIDVDRSGIWIAVWSSDDDLSGIPDFDTDLLVARSVDEGKTWSGPSLLNGNATTDEGEDFNPEIRASPTGIWLAIWESGSSLGGTIGRDQDILFSRSADAGLTWSAVEPLNRSARLDQGLDSFPSLATDGAGNWVALWNSEANLNNGLGSDSDILAAYSTDDARSWSAPIPLSAHSGRDSAADLNPSLATDGRGAWVFVWSADALAPGALPSDPDILVASLIQPFLWSSPTFLHTNATTDLGNDFAPRLATDGRGGWVATWHSSEKSISRSNVVWDIVVSRSIDNGRSWSPAELLYSRIGTQLADGRDPTVATDRQGNWIIVWTSSGLPGGPTGSDSDIFYALSTNHGLSWSVPKAVAPEAVTDAASDFSASIASDGQDGWVVAWATQGGAYGNDFDTLRSISKDRGVTWSPSLPLNTNADTDIGDDFAPRVETDGAGQWIAVWMSNDSLNDTIGRDDDILVSYSTDQGERWTFPRPLNLNAATDDVDDDDYNPRIATDRRGTWLAMWHSESTLANTIGTDFDILMSRSTNNGVSWSAPFPVNTDAGLDTEDDTDPELATDGSGTWIAAWTSSKLPLGGRKGNPIQAEVVHARSFDDGMSWSFPSAVSTEATTDETLNVAPVIQSGGNQWLVAWSSAPDLLNTDYDIRFASSSSATSAFAPPSPTAIALTVQTQPPSPGGAANVVVQWAGGLPPFQLQQRSSLSSGSWVTVIASTCDRSATFPIVGSQQYFRVIGVPSGIDAHLGWLDSHEYEFPGGVNAIAETLFIGGFGLDAEVDVLSSGALPLIVRRTVFNRSSLPIAAGYRVSLEIRGWTFLAVGGDAGYVPGADAQVLFSCQTTNTPALLPGQSGEIEFELGGAGCPPMFPLLALPCGLFRETMTVDSPATRTGDCDALVEVETGNFIFVQEPNRIEIQLVLDPNADPDVLTVDRRRTWVFANGGRNNGDPFTVTTHQLTINTTTPGFGFFVRARMPRVGPEAPTVGTFVPGILQAPATPLVQVAPLVYNYQVTVVPDHNGLSSCNVIGIPFRYEEKVDTTLTVISTNGCAIAQRSILATGIYECIFQ